jgi:hypothetical protein
MAKAMHVVPSPNGGWSVRSSGASRASRVFGKHDDAVAYARDTARREHGDLYVHGRDGTIREKDSYGADPHPPRDRK